ncbi:hypothetical protein SGPA1_31280 [Streptomyces misionensis JCM 4497]
MAGARTAGRARGRRAARAGGGVRPALDAAARARGGPGRRRHGDRRRRLRRPRRLHPRHAQPGGRLPRAGRRRAAGAGEGVSARAAVRTGVGTTTAGAAGKRSSSS